MLSVAVSACLCQTVKVTLTLTLTVTVMTVTVSLSDWLRRVKTVPAYQYCNRPTWNRSGETEAAEAAEPELGPKANSQAANRIKMNLKSGEPHSSKCQRLVSVLLNSFLLSSVDYQSEDNGHLSLPIGFKEEKIFWQPLSSVKRCTGYGLSCIFPLMPFSTHRCRSRQRLPCSQPTLPQGVISKSVSSIKK